MSLLSRFRDFDVYSKPLDDFRVKTSFGGTLTLVSFLVIALLFLSEIWVYLSGPTVVEQLFVDSTRADTRVDINLDITFPKLACPMISVDVMDVSDGYESGILDDIFKQRLDRDGQNITEALPEKQEINIRNASATNTEASTAAAEKKCGSCYGAVDGCCNTCEEVREAYAIRGWQIEDITTIEQCRNDAFVQQFKKTEGEGCRVYGKLQVAKVQGNFHIAPGGALNVHSAHFHNMHSMSAGNFDTTHIINHMSFGQAYPGKEYPLDGNTFTSNKGGLQHAYTLKLVPTMYVFGVTGGGRTEFSYQFSVSKTTKDIVTQGRGVPGFFVFFDFSPLMVKLEERQQ
ncbi:Serologically defined breast cancer antigen NY-BR-84 [Aphelenchoides avenae]|nr:Serologically defined breast cancer antigen NY-BR-84 [Aphelenchus avenae]